ncbi:MAG: GFA family protein [Gammaproteobacteria bacterium]|nr:GFA family protein [Gammaproteobacteria bacterium]
MTANQAADGGCQCGKIRYRLTAEPGILYVCHCSDCQKQSASAFGMSLRMRPRDIEFVEGLEAMQSWDTHGEDGRIKRCHFCPNCGTRVMHGSDDPDETVSIKAGSLDDTSGLRPRAHIWLKSAQPWVAIAYGQYACFDAEPDDGIPGEESRSPESRHV